MQIKTFPIKIERSFERTMPSHAIAIVRRLAHDITRKSKGAHELDQRLELAHAALHMQLYQRYGATHSSEFLQHAHEALDELIAGSHQESQFKLPVELSTPVSSSPTV